MQSVPQTETTVKAPTWIAVDLPFAWGLNDSCNALSWNTGYQYFTGKALTSYLNGWHTGLLMRIKALFGWDDITQVEAPIVRAAIIMAAKHAGDYATARTAKDTAMMFDKELYASWPVQYRPERFQQ